MDFSRLPGLVLVVAGAVLFVTAVQLYTFWASEAVLAALKQRVHEKIPGFGSSIPILSRRRRKAA